MARTTPRRGVRSRVALREQAVSRLCATCAAARSAARVHGNVGQDQQGRAAVPAVRANGGARTTRSLWRVACWRGVKEGGAGGEKEWGGERRVDKEGGKDARSKRGPAFTPCALDHALQWRKVQSESVSPPRRLRNFLFLIGSPVTVGGWREVSAVSTFLAKCLHPGHPATLLRLLLQLATLPPHG